ncbi:MAG: RDD family protein [Candidatus Woesearchaeota archaeon]
MAKELKIIPFAITFKRPSTLKRVLAFLIDQIIILYAFCMPIFSYLAEYVTYSPFSSFDYYTMLLLSKIGIVFTFISFAYFFMFDFLVGSTFGEFLLGINKNISSFFSSLLYGIVYGSFLIFPWLLIIEFATTKAKKSMLEFLGGRRFFEITVQREVYQI